MADEDEAYFLERILSFFTFLDFFFFAKYKDNNFLDKL